MSTQEVEREPAATQPEAVAAVPPAPTPAVRPHPPGAQAVIAIILVLAACYFAKLVLVILVVSILLAFILGPITDFLERFRLPRALAALVVLLGMLAALWGVSAYSYNRASDFVHDLPKYTERIRDTLAHYERKAREFQKTTEKVLPPTAPEKATVIVQQQGNWSGWTDLVARSLGGVTEFVFAVGFVPFLVYFMLTWQEHVRAATVMLFRMENRNAAYVTLGAITHMIRSFIIGNLLVGLFMSTVATIVFAIIGLPYPYFVGVISGFLSLLPYLGVVLAVIPPVVAGLGQIHSRDVVVILATIVGLHVFSLNVLYPKFVGSRVQLNPLAVTVALLWWGWLWGAWGLILAVPITAAMKIIFDHVDSLRPYGAWLGE